MPEQLKGSRNVRECGLIQAVVLLFYACMKHIAFSAHWMNINRMNWVNLLEMKLQSRCY